MNWSYSGENGPEHWCSLCDEYQQAVEETPLQSPIALSTVTAQKETQEQNILDYRPQPQRLIFETSFFNRTIHLRPVEKEKAPKAVLNGTPYILEDIHAHLPSEHVIDGHSFALEVHLVHRSAKEEALVIAVMAEAEKTTAQQFTVEEYTRFFTEENLIQGQRLVVDIAQLLPADSAYFHYSGSLTTPPTIGPVQWIVMQKPLSWPEELINGFERSIGKTNRPLQPDLNRPVYLYER